MCKKGASTSKSNEAPKSDTVLLGDGVQGGLKKSASRVDVEQYSKSESPEADIEPQFDELLEDEAVSETEETIPAIG